MFTPYKMSVVHTLVRRSPSRGKSSPSALTHESQVCKDSEVLSYQEVAQLRGLVAAQQEELRSIHSDCAELQCRSATTEAELQRRSTHEEHALYQRFDDAIKEKDAQVHALQHELSRLQEKKKQFNWNQNALKRNVEQLRHPSLRKELRQ